MEFPAAAKAKLGLIASPPSHPRPRKEGLGVLVA